MFRPELRAINFKYIGMSKISPFRLNTVLYKKIGHIDSADVSKDTMTMIRVDLLDTDPRKSTCWYSQRPDPTEKMGKSSESRSHQTSYKNISELKQLCRRNGPKLEAGVLNSIAIWGINSIFWGII